MATTKGQRIGIWIITAALVVGTIGGFLVLILAPQNQAADKTRFEKLSEEYSTQYNEYQTKVDAQAKELSGQYFATFKAQTSRVAPFTASDVTELKTEDVLVGDGAEITADSSYYAYFLGWNPSGVKFEGGSSFNDDETALNAPMQVTPESSLIEGWKEGVKGMKVGGIRELTIPASLAYGDTAQNDDIPANTPLKFVIYIIPSPEKIEAPQASDELLKLYQSVYGS